MNRKYLILFILFSVFVFCGCSNSMEPENQFLSIVPEIVLPEDEEYEEENSIYKINDLRAEKPSLTGKYVSPYNQEHFFEIIDNRLELSAPMGKYKELEVIFFEGLTWICFKNSLEAGSGSLYFYSADLNTFYKEAPYADLADGRAGYETQPFEKIDEAAGWTDEATEDEKALLYFNPDSFYLGITFSEIETSYPDLEYRGVLAGGSYYYSPDAEASFVFDVSTVNQSGGAGNDDAVTIAFSVAAKQVFPNMGVRILQSEIEKIIGEEVYVGRYEGGNPEVSFHYQGYSFQYYNRETYDILPDTMIVVAVE